jgi:hypothetical protein
MFKEVVDLLIPFAIQPGHFRALLINAFNNEPKLLSRINYEGSAAEIVPPLVQLLRQYGATTDGTQALWQLLLTLKDEVGADREREIESFREWANAPVPSSMSATESKSSTGQGAAAPSFRDVKRKQAQAALKLKIEQYEATSNALVLNMNPADGPKLQARIEMLEAEIQTLEQQIAGLS